jgi:hypothetical protein
LPWTATGPHTPNDFRGLRKRKFIAAISDCVLQNGFTQVLAPTHVLKSADDEWLSIDLDSTQLLRAYLDEADGQRVQILYSLAIPYRVFRNSAERRVIAGLLKGLPVDAIWLRVDGLGRNATPNGVQNYIDAAREFADLSIPVIADGMGGLVGLSLLAFSAVGGIAHGVTFGERVDNSGWRRPRSKRGFGKPRRVYVRELDLMLDPKRAETLLRSSKRAQARFACNDTDCCRLGLRDMLEDPARHFLLQRGRQISTLSRVPLRLRARHFLEHQLRPATDALVEAANLRLNDEPLEKALRAQRKRLDALRVVLGESSRQGQEDRRVALPKTRTAREPRLVLELRP